MFPYWLLFATLALGSILFRPEIDPRTGTVAVDHRMRDNIPLVFVMLVIMLMIGFRYRVGADWVPYQATFEFISSVPLDIALAKTPDEVGYTLLNWAAGQVGGGIWLVNLACAIPCTVGVMALCRQQPNPWLAVLVATPLFIIVVGMGYTRQAVAASFMLIGIAGLARGRSFIWFVAWALLGTTFHTSALFYIPVVAMIMFRANLLWLVVLVAAAAFFYFVILPLALERYTAGYIRSVYEAKGAIFRIVPNAVAGLILLGFPRQFTANEVELRVWRGWALMAIAALAVFFLIQSSVVIDRLSVYLLPLQIFVLARLPSALGRDRRPNHIWTVMVILYSAAVLLLWLSLAYNARLWIPYRFYSLG